MEKLVSEKRNVEGVTEYFCVVCDCWTRPVPVNNDGYTDAVCRDCGSVLEEDFFGFKEIENAREE